MYPGDIDPVNIGDVVVKASDSSRTPVPRVEDLTGEQIQQLTREEIEAIELEESRRSDIASEVDDAELARIEAKERSIRDLIWSDERIKEYQETVAIFGYDSDFVMDEQSYCDNAEMTIPLTREHRIEGEWQTSYISTFSGRSELKVSVVDGAIHSIAETPMNDTVSVQVFTEEQKKAIQIVLDDPAASDVLKGEENWYVGIVRFKVYPNDYDCPAGGCGLVTISVENTKKMLLSAFVDTERGKVVRLNIVED